MWRLLLKYGPRRGEVAGLRPSWIGERFAQHIAAAGLPPIRLLPSCRHTAATILLAEAAGSLAALLPRGPGPRRAGQLSGNSAPQELVSSGGGDRL